MGTVRSETSSDEVEVLSMVIDQSSESLSAPVSL